MNLEKEILKELKPFCNQQRAAHDLGYMNTKFILLGVDVPSTRKVAKSIFDKIDFLPYAQQRELMEKLWRVSKYYDILSIPLYFFQTRKGMNDLTDWRIIKNWTTKIDNWGHSDVLSDSIADLVERFPKEIYPILKIWNNSKHSWQRRLSLTSLIYYHNARRKHLPVLKIMPLVKARLHDNDKYVQKAVGWTLRECGHVYPNETKHFIKTHLSDLSAIAFSYATEKWSITEKSKLIKLRQQKRRAG